MKLACQLFGSTTPLSPQRLAELYSDSAGYTSRFEASVDQSISGGWVLESDREALLGFMDPSRIEA